LGWNCRCRGDVTGKHTGKQQASKQTANKTAKQQTGTVLDLTAYKPTLDKWEKDFKTRR
jgi:hypothetical protein